jgi:hypothetical protein
MTLNGVTNVYFPELTTAAGATLYTPTIYDPDAGQTQTITINVYPSGQTDMFTVTGSMLSSFFIQLGNRISISSY